jgi:hypothetical protein
MLHGDCAISVLRQPVFFGDDSWTSEFILHVVKVAAALLDLLDLAEIENDLALVYLVRRFRSFTHKSPWAATY